MFLRKSENASNIYRYKINFINLWILPKLENLETYFVCCAEAHGGPDVAKIVEIFEVPFTKLKLEISVLTLQSQTSLDTWSNFSWQLGSMCAPELQEGRGEVN